MTDKRFTHVGVATYKNKTKLRYTNGNVDARVKILNKSGFTGVEFFALPEAMTKSEALRTDVVKELAQRHNLKLEVAPEAGEASSASEAEAA